ncbi:hypothetical protein J2W28_004920 [Variovorax boronicumulans]|uniref:hypothetical protein n=1 Tax=Variovorax boronicumulans TaxID=436515 RepID=UPI00278B56CC|nr:hypothetical protein [Variovorax boronicumulans]MDP9994550.1 hypothetical protein [Variovorax boronicumulans]MDQ0005751.1 hypothetical protein [Variovorax boronicumulans]MDQ0044385.1 hypothetical protein [Variovorax boronicumulans]
MKKLTAVVCFGLPEQQVDILMEGLTTTLAEPRKWIVFGSDANLLAALKKLWGETIELIAVIVPASTEGLEEAALSILQSEQVALSEAVWVLGSGTAWRGPDDALAIFHSVGVHVDSLVTKLANLTAGR